MERIPAPIEITKSQAEAIAESTRNGPRRNVLMSRGPRWYDIRHLSEAELLAELVRRVEPARAP
jgi:hypothetical protein